MIIFSHFQNEEQNCYLAGTTHRCRPNPVPYIYPCPSFLSAILPLATDLQGVVIEMFSNKMV